MRENTCKQCNQHIHTTQYQKNNPIRKWAEDLNRHLSREDIQTTNRHTHKNAQHCYLLEKCKLKPQWDITLHLSESKSTNNKCWRGCGEKWTPYTVGGNVNWCSHCRKEYGGSSKKLKIELPYDPAIPLLGVYPGKMKTLIQKDTCTSMFIAALFTIAKTWKQQVIGLRRCGDFIYIYKISINY